MLDGTRTAPHDGPATAAAAPARAFRPDVEGLRAVAVGLVVLFHAGVAALPGGFVGVDVFFVLSGFLITGLLVEELARTGTISIRGFYARRVRRLLPLAVLVLAVTALVSWAVVPPVDHPRVGGDVLAAALYAANWRFAGTSTEYMGADVDKSPVLHFWSLGVEEQFYVVWPLLLLLATGALLVRRRRARGPLPRAAVVRRAAVALALVGGASFAASVVLSPTTGGWAYYGLHTRAWELAVGGGLALALAAPGPLSRLPRPAAVLLGWAGVAAVVASAVLIDGSTAFPGSAALGPVLGTAALVAAGAGVGGAAVRGSASRVLSHPVPRYVGRISYAWYLWHWPFLVLGRQLGTERGWDPALVVVAAVVLSFAASALSNVLVEEPARRSRWLSLRPVRSLAAGALLTAAGVAAALVLGPARGPVEVPDQLAEQVPQVQGDVEAPAQAPAVPVLTPEQARADTERPPDCFVSYSGTRPPAECVFGDPEGTVDVAMIGDSHAMHWYPALDALARERGWRLHMWAKTACPSIDVRVWVDKYATEYDACGVWREGVLQQLEQGPRMDLLLVARSMGYVRATLGEGDEVLPGDAVGAAWQEAAERTLPRLGAVADRVLVVRDNPWAPEDVPTCLSARDPADWEGCSFDRETGTYLDEDLAVAERTAARRTGAPLGFLDMTDVLCPGARCPVVADNGVIMYVDNSHFTDTFSRSLTTELGRRIDLALRNDPLPAGGEGAGG
ncbi:acyltransferase family protein [Vallicoccus soli]|nr:acyltransferase family protein [Vallicoccus soli]